MYRNDIPLYDFPYQDERLLPFLIQEFDPGEPWEQHALDRHTFYALFWVVEGNGFHHIDYTGYVIRPQTLYLMRPGQSHFFEVDKRPLGISIFFLEEFLYLNNQFSPTELFYLIDRCPALYLPDPLANRLQQIIDQLMAEYQTKSWGYVNALQHLLQLLLIHVRRYYYQPNASLIEPTAATHLSSQFQRLVDQQFLTCHDLKTYADQLGVTAGHLSEQVKVVTGRSAAHVIRQRLVSEAKRLLAHTQLTVSEICTNLGFKDSSYFARFFRREVGKAPLAFRHSYREKYRNAPR